MRINSTEIVCFIVAYSAKLKEVGRNSFRLDFVDIPHQFRVTVNRYMRNEMKR